MLKLLIVDDNPADRAMLRRILSSADIASEIDEIRWASEFLEYPLEGYDCVLLDNRLPDRDGIDALQEVCRDRAYPPCPIVVMSGQGDERTAARAIDAGANDYLIKDSLTPNILRKTFAAAIEKWHADEAMHSDWETQKHALLSAERSNFAKTQFIANLSHQLRVPLTAIIGFADLINQGQLGDDRDAWNRYQNYAGDISISASKVLELVGGIIDLARIEGGDVPISKSTFDPRRALRQVINNFADHVDAAKVDLQIDDKTAPQVMCSDDRAFSAIMSSLLSNAIKFTPAGNHVRVQLSDLDDKMCLFAVADTGVGMNPDDIRHLTRPFERYRSHSLSDDSNLGIGLPLANSLVKVLGGDLKFDTAPGMGTTATVVLPKTAPEDSTQ